MNISKNLIDNKTKAEPGYDIIYPIMDQVALIIQLYINKIICGFGIVLNLFFLTLLSDKSLRYNISNTFGAVHSAIWWFAL